MRFSGKFALKVGAVGVAAGAILTPATAALAGGPAIVITPHTGLHNNDSVTVTGSGYTPAADIAVLECSANPVTAASQCDTSAFPTNQVTVAADGTFSKSIVVKTGTIGDGTCAAGSSNCSIVAGNVANQTEQSSGGISFAAAGPVIIAKPKAPADGSTIKVSGSGFPKKAEPVAIVTCSSPTDQTACDTNDVELGSTTAAGTFTNLPLKVNSTKHGGKCQVGKTCYVVATTDLAGQGADKSQDAVTTVKIVPGVAAARTKTTAKYVAAKHAILGKVTSSGHAVRGIKTELKRKAGSHWKKVATARTNKHGAYIYKHIKRTGKYQVKTLKNHKYRSSTSKVVKV